MHVAQEFPRVSDMFENVGKYHVFESLPLGDQLLDVARYDAALSARLGRRDLRRVGRGFNSGNRQTPRGRLREKVPVPAPDLQQPTRESGPRVCLDQIQVMVGRTRL